MHNSSCTTPAPHRSLSAPLGFIHGSLARQPLLSPFLSNSIPRATKKRPRVYFTSPSQRRVISAVSTEPKTSRSIRGDEIPLDNDVQPEKSPENLEQSERMFSNLTMSKDGSLIREKPSELACTALVAGTMIGAGVLALPSVAAPSGFLPSTATLLAIWGYMSVTGLLISEVTINTACALGRASGVSMLSLGRLTLGPAGGIATSLCYVFLHYAILTAYTSQGGHILHSILPYISISSDGALFALAIGLPMLLAPARVVAQFNNLAVAAAALTFAAVVTPALPGAHLFDILHSSHWLEAFDLGKPLIPVTFVSCVYHNVVSTVSMRLEGDRSKIRRAILIGSGIPIVMFILYDAVMLGTTSYGSSVSSNSVAVTALFSALAIATSFVGFVEGLTELFADVRQTAGLKLKGRWPDFAATLVPPIGLSATSPDIFFKALDVAGTYGIAVLFGFIPAAMAWRNRSEEATKEFDRLVAGGNLLLAGIAAFPVALIANRVWGMLNHLS